MGVVNNILLTRRFFWFFSTAIIIYACGFVIPLFESIGSYLLFVLLILVSIDLLLLLTSGGKPEFSRNFNERLNLGDENAVILSIRNNSRFSFNYELNEGFPDFQQEREKVFFGKLSSGEKTEIKYNLLPKKRGKFNFNDAFLFFRTFIGLIERRFIYDEKDTFHVYPSVLQMKKYELLVFQQQKTASGIKRIRRLGNAKEFEQIRNYVQGDELKTINWKATSRRMELMVNQYQEEKSQHVYCIVDKSRTMQLEFDGLNLLDYSINSSLVFANICLLKGDKFGLFTFSDKIGTQIPADSSSSQMKLVIDALYNQKTKFRDANYELLQSNIRQKIKTRSLLLLFSNFENEFAMRRALPYLQQINKKHLLIVVFFQNSELKKIAYLSPLSLNQLYTGIIAERMITMKARMARELKQYGIQTILTNPEELSAGVINKYLELKARGSF
jgi:uncharacterized protein (DUF58 family)